MLVDYKVPKVKLRCADIRLAAVSAVSDETPRRGCIGKILIAVGLCFV